MSANKSFKFVLVLLGIDENTPGLEDALFEAGCDDVIVNFKNNTVYLDFDRDAIDFESAVLSAIENVKAAKLPIKTIDLEPTY